MVQVFEKYLSSTIPIKGTSLPVIWDFDGNLNSSQKEAESAIEKEVQSRVDKKMGFNNTSLPKNKLLLLLT